MTVNAVGLQSLLRSMSDGDKKFERNVKIVKGHTISIDVPDSSKVAARDGYKWVREWGMNGGVFQVVGAAVQDRVNLPVLVAYEPKIPWRRIIIGVDWSSVIDFTNYDGDPFLPNHAASHEWPDYDPGSDVVNVYPRALVPLRTYPGSVDMTITVAPLRYVFDGDYVEFPGEVDIDISAHQPAVGYAVMVLVYLDLISGVVEILAGSAIVDTPTFNPQPPTFPSDAAYSSLIRLDGDATSIYEIDITDIRQLFVNDSLSVTSTLSASRVGEMLISNDGETLELGIPVVDIDGQILVDSNGHIIVV